MAKKSLSKFLPSPDHVAALEGFVPECSLERRNQAFCPSLTGKEKGRSVEIVRTLFDKMK